MLAHRAMAQGEIVDGRKRRFAPWPSGGVSPTRKSWWLATRLTKHWPRAWIARRRHSPFSANGRSLSVEAGERFAREVARKDSHQIVGWQAVGHAVSEQSAGFCYEIEMGARLEDVAGIIHAHPTLGEAIQESPLRPLGRALPS